MKHATLFSLLVLGFLSCNKGDGASKPLNVTGKIIDDVTGQPIVGMPVHLVGPTGGFTPQGYFGDQTPLASDTTDSQGTYSLSLESAAGESHFVYPVAAGQYVRSVVADGQNYKITGTGNQVRDLRCYRAATVTIELKNTFPVSPTNMTLAGPFDAVVLTNQVHDTFISLRVIGNIFIRNRITFTTDVRAPMYANVSAAPADTVYTQYDF